MLAPRWKKVLSDLIVNPVRSALVIISIVIGVFGVGVITSSQAIIMREMNSTYRAAIPAHATLSVSDVDSFDSSLVTTVKHMPEVGDAEARRLYSAQVFTRHGDWRSLRLMGIADFDDIRIDRFLPQQGATKPGDREVLLERSGIGETGLNIGDTLVLERPDGKRRQLLITGIVYAPTEPPAQFMGTLGYVNMATMDWISGRDDFNQLLFVSAENGDDQARNEMVAEAVYEKVQKSGRNPAFPNVPVPNKHPLDQFIQGMVTVLGSLGVMAVFLSGFLVTNTISALLAQQIRQIGIMKSIGAQRIQIIQMYMVLVLSFGLIALLIAFPLSRLVTRQFVDLVAAQFNFELTSYAVPPSVMLVQVGISLITPVLAALLPVWNGTSITINEALGSEGGAGSYGRGLLDRLIQRVRGLPRPMLLSLRNTFRRKGRVALTLTTLTLGGAIFISMLSVRLSLTATMDNILNSLFDYDVNVQLERAYRDSYIITEAERVPGVESAEMWRGGAGRRVLPSGNEGEAITIFAVPPDTTMMNPNIIQGRWLLPDDQNAIVMSTGVMQDDTDLRVGDTVTLKIAGRDTTWQIVGVMPAIGDTRWAYTSYEAFGRANREVGTADTLLVKTTERSGAFQREVAAALDAHLSSLGVNVAGTETLATIREQQETFFNVIIFALLAMTLLIAVVGGLGLTGTMSLNVIERTREIGVMRAIGASDGSILQIVLAEGMVLGMLSWALGVLLSFPLSRILAEQVGVVLFSLPLSFSFAADGALLWLIISLVVAAVASFLPAWRASQMTVRDVLAYE